MVGESRNTASLQNKKKFYSKSLPYYIPVCNRLLPRPSLLKKSTPLVITRIYVGLFVVYYK